MTDILVGFELEDWDRFVNFKPAYFRVIKPVYVSDNLIFGK